MSIKPFEQILAEIGTTIGIDSAAKDPAGRYAAAQAALLVAAAFTAAASGDVSVLTTQLETTVLTKVTDPGQVKLVTDLFALGNTFLAPIAAASTAVPLITPVVQGIATNVAAGITAVASAYKPA
jgi:hypothetical protein